MSKNKFAKQFSASNKETFESRGVIIVKQMTNVSTQLVLELENKKSALELEIIKTMDFGKSHTTQLKIDEPNSYKEHLERLKGLKMELAQLDFELDIMKEIHSEWFEEAKETE